MGKYFSDDALSVMSSLIGLSRALESDTNPLDDVMTLLLDTTVHVSEDELSFEKDKLREKLLEAKKRTVPSCFVCQHPCGHNDDYPMEKIGDIDNEATREIFTLLEKIIRGDAVPEEKKRELTLKSLIYISSDFGKEYIASLISSLGEYCVRC